jgi:hypothetical protein
MNEARELTAEAVVASCLERIAVREPVVRAWAYLGLGGRLSTRSGLSRRAHPATSSALELCQRNSVTSVRPATSTDRGC